ncbi:FG-GAP repeat domain-containing protein [Streptomyces sp. NPDC088923]|uniref:FG-GAP repeat domain-containing protein n=1 Tax=Streptomyces sp. NPDC088923 TaxID=3365913 RepID=UPI003806B5F2
MGRTRAGLTAGALCWGLLLTGCGGDATPADPAPLATGHPHRPADPADLNGDGYADAFLSDGEDEGVVLWGAKDGLDARRLSRIEVSGAPVRADLDADGYTDLVAATPRGTTVLLRGGPRGPAAPRALRTPAGFRPRAAGDFDGDGTTDLFDGGQGGTGDTDSLPEDPQRPARVLQGPFTDDGAPARTRGVDAGQHGYSSPATVAAADFDGDGASDLVLGYGYDAEDDDNAPRDLTRVAYYKGGPEGPRRDRAREKALLAAAGPGEGGFASLPGDTDGDAAAELLVPGSAPGGHGRVTVLHGGPGGPGTGGKPDVYEGRQGSFGSSVLTGRVDGDARGDLVIGVAGAHRHDDWITVRATRAGTQRLTALDEGMPGRPNAAHWNEFLPLALLDANGDHHADLLAHAPRHDGGKGVYVLLRGTDKGLSFHDVRSLAPASLGLG